MVPDCPFCAVSPERVVARNAATIALWDAFPVTEGHGLVVPVRHVASLFDLSPDERAAVWAEVASLRAWLAAVLEVDAFTIGTNDGVLAGQTVPHHTST